MIKDLKRNAKPVTDPEAAPNPHRDEVRALRKENHNLRLRIEELERALQAADESEAKAVPEEIEDLPPETDSETLDPEVVRGKRVLVVGGDSKETVYREIVDEMGGEMRFIPAGYGRPIEKTHVSGADGIIFVATQVNHNVFNRVKAHAKDLGVPYRIVTFKGNEAFEAAVIECLT